jgi:ubiquinone/menaquinone biosynthesis C-methylase UbiE/uncharacterized membrane protein YbhN (UPF0104 family)
VRLALLAIVVAAVGAVSTIFWLGSARPAPGGPTLLSAPALLALALCAALTTANLLLRWFRWHFLVRRFTRHITTRDSLAVYMATVPAILTPFFLGELVRVVILRKRAPGKTGQLTWVFVIERIMDALVLVWFLLLATRAALGLLFLPVLVGVSLVMFRQLLVGRHAGRVPAVTLTALSATILAWALPILALVATVGLCARAVPLATGVRAFSAGTLSGALSGLPLGVSITGSTMIAELEHAGVPAGAAVLSVLVHRIGTSWFALALGIASFLVSRRRLVSVMRGTTAGHFDEIAHEYEEQIPKHVRDRLLAKKTGLIREVLRARGVPDGAPGLDLGCGQGWYLSELARAGFAMQGTDYSGGQLRKARAHAADPAAPVPASSVFWTQADGQALPFASDRFDFAYSINAFHHFPSPEAQVRALREVVRVLRPGGVFVLHEINTHNPVFRLYMSYLFPLLKQIDEGTEHWLLPASLPVVSGAAWEREPQYFTFLPDFVPGGVQRALQGFEHSLERSFLRSYSAHYQACLVKAGPAAPQERSRGEAS